MFPISIKGSLRLKLGVAATDSHRKIAAARIADMLDEAQADDVAKDGNTVTFTVRFFRWAWNWNILELIDRGELWVEPFDTAIVVHYRFRTVRHSLIGMGFITAILVLAGFSNTNFLLWPFGPLGVIWLLLLGLSHLIAMIRLPLWLRFGLRKCPELQKR